MVYPIAVGREKAHDAGMPEKAQRRRFTAAYKLQILQEAEAGAKIGEVCRRHGITGRTFHRWWSVRIAPDDGRPAYTLGAGPKSVGRALLGRPTPLVSNRNRAGDTGPELFPSLCR